jgi:FkbM family methyltransferase
MLDRIDVVVTTVEINHLHGTGPLVKRVFEGRRNLFSIRSRDQWGAHDFGDWSITLPQPNPDPTECIQVVRKALAGRHVDGVLCVPYLIDELLTSIAIKEAFDARLCAWLMDDQNVATSTIPDAVMRQFLEKCSLRLATHPELAVAYQLKYGLPFFVLPAVVPEVLVARHPIELAHDLRERKGILLGSFWDQSWFDRLCEALSGSSWEIDWYGNNSTPFLKFPVDDLARARIRPFGLIPEDKLSRDLRKYPFVMVPAGALDGVERNTGVASLSLPGRILFATATSHIPILVVGSEETCAARFVKNFGIGETAPYEAAELAAAMERISDPEMQRKMRANAAAIGPAFSDRGVVDWLAESIELGRPADTRFGDAFAGYEVRGQGPGEEPLAPSLAEEGLMEFLCNLLPTRKAVDIGAHVGEVSECLLRSGYEVYAFEPNPPVYEKLIQRLGDRENFHPFRLAIGSQEGEMPLHLAEDLSGFPKYADVTLLSSLAVHGTLDDLGYTATTLVPVRNIESLTLSRMIPEDVSLVKIDTEGFDLEVIRGMGDYRYPVVAAEFWDQEILWGRYGLLYTLSSLVAEMKDRGYHWYLVIYRVWGRNDVWYYPNHSRSVANSWGNVFFFRSEGLFSQAQAWCSAVVARTYFESGM